jgi:hypothetical protein
MINYIIDRFIHVINRRFDYPPPYLITTIKVSLNLKCLKKGFILKEYSFKF